MTASVPEKASLNHSFTIDVAVSGPIAGLQAQVMLDQKAAEVGGVIPVGPQEQGLNPVMNHGGARIGAYGAKAFSDGKFLRIAIFPRKAGRLYDPPRPHRGRHGIGTPRPDPPRAAATSPCRSARPSASSAAATVTAALPGRIARGHIQADSIATASSRARISSTVTYGWSAGNGAGDVDRNGRVDVADLQTVLSR